MTLVYRYLPCSEKSWKTYLDNYRGNYAPELEDNWRTAYARLEKKELNVLSESLVQRRKLLSTKAQSDKRELSITAIRCDNKTTCLYTLLHTLQFELQWMISKVLDKEIKAEKTQVEAVWTGPFNSSTLNQALGPRNQNHSVLGGIKARLDDFKKDTAELERAFPTSEFKKELLWEKKALEAENKQRRENKWALKDKDLTATLAEPSHIYIAQWKTEGTQTSDPVGRLLLVGEKADATDWKWDFTTESKIPVEVLLLALFRENPDKHFNLFVQGSPDPDSKENKKPFLRICQSLLENWAASFFPERREPNILRNVTTFPLQIQDYPGTFKTKLLDWLGQEDQPAMHALGSLVADDEKTHGALTSWIALDVIHSPLMFDEEETDFTALLNRVRRMVNVALRVGDLQVFNFAAAWDKDKFQNYCRFWRSIYMDTYFSMMFDKYAKTGINVIVADAVHTKRYQRMLEDRSQDTIQVLCDWRTADLTLHPLPLELLSGLLTTKTPAAGQVTPLTSFLSHIKEKETISKNNVVDIFANFDASLFSVITFLVCHWPEIMTQRNYWAYWWATKMATSTSLEEANFPAWLESVTDGKFSTWTDFAASPITSAFLVIRSAVEKNQVTLESLRAHFPAFNSTSFNPYNPTFFAGYKRYYILIKLQDKFLEIAPMLGSFIARTTGRVLYEDCKEKKTTTTTLVPFQKCKKDAEWLNSRLKAASIRVAEDRVTTAEENIKIDDAVLESTKKRLEYPDDEKDNSWDNEQEDSARPRDDIEFAIVLQYRDADKFKTAITKTGAVEREFKDWKGLAADWFSSHNVKSVACSELPQEPEKIS